MCVVHDMYVSIVDILCGVYVLLYMYDGVHGVCTVCMDVIGMWDCIMCMLYIACVVYVCMRYWHCNVCVCARGAGIYVYVYMCMGIVYDKYVVYTICNIYEVCIYVVYVLCGCMRSYIWRVCCTCTYMCVWCMFMCTVCILYM